MGYLCTTPDTDTNTEGAFCLDSVFIFLYIFVNKLEVQGTHVAAPRGSVEQSSQPSKTKKNLKDCELESLVHRDSQQLDEYGTEVNVSWTEKERKGLF